jgi:thioredoxin 1
MSQLHSTTDATFEQDTSQGLVLVDFWAPWCGPCQIMLPRLESLAASQGEKVHVMKCNVDENQATAMKFRIMSIPTMILFKDGVRVEQVIGLRELQDLEQLIVKHS